MALRLGDFEENATVARCIDCDIVGTCLATHGQRKRVCGEDDRWEGQNNISFALRAYRHEEGYPPCRAWDSCSISAIVLLGVHPLPRGSLGQFLQSGARPALEFFQGRISPAQICPRREEVLGRA